MKDALNSIPKRFGDSGWGRGLLSSLDSLHKSLSCGGSPELGKHVLQDPLFSP